MPYNPIENYGLIGNLRTAALVSKHGSIDWLCLPRFDSGSVFAEILDERIGGSFSIQVIDKDTCSRQHYLPGTNILVTKFLHPCGIAELQDYMPMSDEAVSALELVRRVTVSNGSCRFRLVCRPAFDYARVQHEVHRVGDGFLFHSPGLTLTLASDLHKLHIEGNSVVAEFDLEQGASAGFILRLSKDGKEPPPLPSADYFKEAFLHTCKFWRNWLSQCTYGGRWRERVERSALILKLLTHEPTGAIIAAATTSLPESLGHGRNWDYRYVWIRDGSFTARALLRLGFRDEALKFLDWVMQRIKETAASEHGPLRTVYTIDGAQELPELELSHLDGYAGCKPVRIGNGAAKQLQLDIYGELMEAVYSLNLSNIPIDRTLWMNLQSVIEWVSENWQRPDAGIWEVRGGQQQNVYSKFMCWVALDRALKLAELKGLTCPQQRWSAAKDMLYNSVIEQGWSQERNAFVQSYGSKYLDASALVMPLVSFVDADDPRMVATIDAIMRPYGAGGLSADGLVLRYRNKDGLSGSEGTFNACSFWLVQALAKAGQTNQTALEQAREIFENLLASANSIGLYSEETGMTGKMLGNFPQALSHLEFINAALELDEQLNRR